MNLHTIFLREGCMLPDQVELSLGPFCSGWTEVIGVIAPELDASIRSAGWHFMWMTDSRSSRGLGATPEIAVRRAAVNALKRVSGRFNAAELGSFQVTKFLGLQIARVVLNSRQIQSRSSLALAAESRLKEVLAH